MRSSVIGAVCLVAASPLTCAPHVTSAQNAGNTRATVKIEARFPDGSSPVAEGTQCYLMGLKRMRPQWDPEVWGRATVAVTGKPEPVAAGSGGDWILSDLAEGLWLIRLAGPGFAQTHHLNRQVLCVFAEEPPEDQPTPVDLRNYDVTKVLIGEPVTLKLALVRGGTVMGQITAAENGQPVAGATVSVSPAAETTPEGADNLDRTVFPPSPRPVRTDAGGRYSFANLPPAHTMVYAKAEGRASSRTERFDLGDRDTRDADLQLQRGGWISGRIELPEGAPGWDDVLCHIVCRREGGTGSFTFGDTERGEFRTEPLLPGRYSVDARAQTWKGFNPREALRWSGDAERVTVAADEETADITIEVAPEERE